MNLVLFVEVPLQLARASLVGDRSDGEGYRKILIEHNDVYPVFLYPLPFAFGYNKYL